MKKRSNKNIQKNKASTVQEAPKELSPNAPNIKKIILWTVGGVLLAMILIAIGWYLGHQSMEKTI